MSFEHLSCRHDGTRFPRHVPFVVTQHYRLSSGLSMTMTKMANRTIVWWNTHERGRYKLFPSVCFYILISINVYHPLELELLENEFCSLYLMLQVKISKNSCIIFFLGASREEGKCKQEIMHQGPDDGGSTYLWNVGRQLFYTAEHPRRQIWTSYSPPWEL
jgi:hypothetical protein